VATADTEHQGQERDLERGEWRLLGVLGLPTFAYALATTVVTTYLPVVARQFGASNILVGLLIAVEGIMALLVALPAGAWSDRRSGRLPFVTWGTPPLVLALAAMGFVTSLPFALLAVIVFFAAYFLAYEPYRAMYPDLVDEEIAGRSQSTQALWRGAGTIVAIASGGVLLSVGKGAPFIIGAAVTAAAIVAFVVLVPRKEGKDEQRSGGVRDDIRRVRELVGRRGDVRAFMVANGLWEASLGALKTFIMLYLTVGLGVKTGMAGVAVAVGAIFIAAATPVSGKLADRFGTIRVLRVALLIYGVGLLVPFFVDSKIVVAAVAPVFGFGGGVVMTLPYALLMPLMDDDDHGLTTGLYSVSRGVGTALGPLAAGIAVNASAASSTAPRATRRCGASAPWRSSPRSRSSAACATRPE
jgi:MFS family permease